LKKWNSSDRGVTTIAVSSSSRTISAFDLPISAMLAMK